MISSFILLLTQSVEISLNTRNTRVGSNLVQASNKTLTRLNYAILVTHQFTVNSLVTNDKLYLLHVATGNGYLAIPTESNTSPREHNLNTCIRAVEPLPNS